MPEATIGSAIGLKLFSAAFSAFAKSILTSTAKTIYAALSKGTSFEAHTKVTFERCTKIRTLLNRDESVDLLALYVNQRFRSGEKTIDDYDLIADIPVRKRTIIAGSGGGGKTVFMKYLWIALFENPKGKIPVFIELRRLNDVTVDNLTLYIYHSIVDTQAILSLADFEQGIKEGAFIFILDGFDEIVAERRDSLEKQILKLGNNNPDLTIVVSSRSDDRFHAWQSFSVFHVLPLREKQVTELIQKLNYDETTKKKFIGRIRRDLFQKHESFLSNPLLATMMLLTFDQFADIPEKVHLFYEQAFDTLFARHDATKEAFKRKSYTNLSIDVFKRYLSYFCLATYYDEKFELSETETLSYISKGLKIEPLDIEPADFLNDLVESVCTLQKDGMSLTFTHRSFQEFFAAYCLANVAQSHLSDILMKFARRSTDNVINMLYDMRRDLVELEFILPKLRALKKEIESLPREEMFLPAYCRLLETEVVISKYGKAVEIAHSRHNNWVYFIDVLRTIYPSIFAKVENTNAHQVKDRRILRRKLSPKLLKSGDFEIDLAVNRNLKFETNDADGSDIPKDFGWLHETGYADYCRGEAECIVEVLVSVEKRRLHADKAIDTLLGLKN